MLVLIIKVVLTWLIFLIVSTNLIGLIIRGLKPRGEIDKLENEAHPIIKNEIEKYRTSGIVFSAIFGLLSLVILYFLYRYMNLGAVIAVILIMGARVPDLLWEIKTGMKATGNNQPKGLVYTLASGLTWLSLIVIYLSYK